MTINGSGFFGTTAVSFHGTTVSSFVVVSDKKITTSAPTGVTTGTVSVTNLLGTAVSANVFTVTGPKINSFSPPGAGRSGPP